jgi:hypothetical protein
MAVDPRIRYVQRMGEKSVANVCRNIGINESLEQEGVQAGYPLIPTD